MNILAIDSATDACSVALLAGGDRLLDHRMASQQHASLLLPMIDTLMKQAGRTPGELDAIAFGRGPGSFTGVRIATAVAQGVALGAGCPLVGVSSLRAIAQGCLRDFGDSRLAVLLDARMQEVYWGLYERDEPGIMHGVGEEQVCPASRVPDEALTGVIAGAGAERYFEELTQRMPETELTVRQGRWPNALDLLTLAEPCVAAGRTMAPADANPVYLRNKVAQTEAERAM